MLQFVVRSQGPAVNPRRLPAGPRLLARACRPFAAIVLASPLALATPLVPATPVAQAPHVHEIPSVPKDILERPIPRRNGIGDAHDAVSTRSADAQAFYDQGLAYLHDYVWIEAA